MLSLNWQDWGRGICPLQMTLNRVMIVELDVPSSIVALMISLPILFAPFRAFIGFKSDTHQSALGLKRFPFIYRGTLLQFGGFAIMPFALLLLSGYGEAADLPRWYGVIAAGLAFLLVGAGVHIVQTVGLALATDLVREEDQPKVVGLMYVMLLFGMIGSAFLYGALLENYTPGRLIQVIQGAAITTVVLNTLAVWKQESRIRRPAPAHVPSFSEAWGTWARAPGALRLLVVIALGTFAFGMADVLLEPYGGQVLRLSVAETTRLTAMFGLGTLGGLAAAWQLLSRGGAPERVAALGALVGIPGFALIISASQIGMPSAFVMGTILTGVGAGLFGHGTLTATIRRAPKGHIGLALGAWGATQATAAGFGVALGGIARDVIKALPGVPASATEIQYIPVFATEIVFLVLALLIALPLWQVRSGQAAKEIYVP